VAEDEGHAETPVLSKPEVPAAKNVPPVVVEPKIDPKSPRIFPWKPEYNVALAKPTLLPKVAATVVATTKPLDPVVKPKPVPPVAVEIKKPDVAVVEKPVPLVDPTVTLPPSAVADVSPSVVAPAAKPTPTASTGNGKTYFYRWGARSDDPDLISASLIKIITRYNALKAGELELGAEYRGGRYFHFTIDQGKYEALVSEIRDVHLEGFSATRTESDRKDEQGRIRIVFWVGPTKM
jgi:hypothetical protein